MAAILAAWQAECPELDVSPVGIFGRITRIERYKSLALRQIYRRHGIDAGEYDVLAALRRSGLPYRLTPTQLSRSVLVTSATMTQILDRLERLRLIRRQPAARDRRSVLIELTAPGRALFDRVHRDLLDAEASMLTRLSQRDRTSLAELLARFAGLLEHSASEEAADWRKPAAGKTPPIPT